MSIEIVILPRKSMTWQEFLASTPERSIALDGVVRGGPAWDEKTLHANFDHHDGVVREATMSTAMQVLFAIKGGLMDRMGKACRLYVNDLIRIRHLLAGFLCITSSSLGFRVTL